MTRPTASALGLASRCLYSFTVECPPSEAGPAAERGTAFHAILAEYIADSATNAGEFAAMFDGWREWWNDNRIVRGTYHYGAEAPVAYDPNTDTARWLPSDGHRDYSAALPHEFVGTMDCIGCGVGSIPHVYDWKTGDPAHVDPCKTNRQMRFLALCAARLHDADSASATLVFVDEDGTITADTCTYDSLELAAIASEMAQLDRALRDHPQPKPGAHCRYCPAVSVCPATQKALAQVAPAEVETPYSMGVAIESADHASWLLHRLRAVRSAADAVEAALKAYADANGGIPSGEKVWAGREVQVERIDLNDDAREALEAILPAALKATCTKASIKAAAKKEKAKEQAALDALRAAGAVTTTVTRRYEEK